MKTFTTADIRSLNPCYDPSKHLSEAWSGTILDILDLKSVPLYDRIWVILHQEFVSEKFMRIFAVWCVRQIEHLLTNERSRFALEFMEAYIEWRYLIDDPDWVAMWESERYAAAAATAVTYATAAYATAAYATTDAAYAAYAATTDAATYATYAAAYATAAAIGAAAYSAAAATRDATGAAQEDKLRAMIIAAVDTEDLVML